MRGTQVSRDIGELLTIVLTTPTRREDLSGNAIEMHLRWQWEQAEGLVLELFSADDVEPASAHWLDWEVRRSTRTSCVTAVTIVTNLNRAALLAALLAFK